MYDKEHYEKYKEAHKRASRKYYLKHKDYYNERSKKYYKEHFEKLNELTKIRRKIWVEVHRDWNREYQRKYKSTLSPDRIPETDEYDTFFVDLNLKIEKEGFINGSKC